MDNKDKLKQMEENPELAKSLEEALRRNADEKELSDIISDAGIDADFAENLLAECQRRRGAVVSDERVDEGALHMVAGGKYNWKAGGCTESLYKEQCAATVENDSWCWSNDYCELFSDTYQCVTAD